MNEWLISKNVGVRSFRKLETSEFWSFQEMENIRKSGVSGNQITSKWTYLRNSPEFRVVLEPCEWILTFPPFVFSIPSFFSQSAGTSSRQHAHQSNMTCQGTPFAFNLGKHLVCLLACYSLCSTNLLPRFLVIILILTLHMRSSGLALIVTGPITGLQTCIRPTLSAL